jgi:exonuclease V
VIGEQVFAMDEAELGAYVGHGMGWWRGERAAEGVAIQEAFKCRSCEFAEGCEWRLGQVEEARRRARGGWKG